MHTYISYHCAHYTTVTLQYINALHCITVHYTTLHHITLHCITLHYTILHYIYQFIFYSSTVVQAFTRLLGSMYNSASWFSGPVIIVVPLSGMRPQMVLGTADARRPRPGPLFLEPYILYILYEKLYILP